jgi:DNA mismatch repair protein MSH4
LKFDPARQYWLRFRLADIEGATLPDELINRVMKRGYLECQTLALQKLNQRIHATAMEVVALGDGIITQLLDRVRELAQKLFRISDAVAVVDMLAAFAHNVAALDYVRPELGTTLALKGARHPILDKVLIP